MGSILLVNNPAVQVRGEGEKIGWGAKFFTKKVKEFCIYLWNRC